MPHASSLPPALDLSPCAPRGGPTFDGFDEGGGDGYLWPLCAQPLFEGGSPLRLNLTLLCGAALRLPEPRTPPPRRSDAPTGRAATRPTAR